MSRVSDIWGVGIFFMVITTLVVCLRAYTRVKIVKQFGVDDVFISVALVLNFVFVICIFVSCEQGGLGRHIEDVSPSELATFVQANWSSSLAYGIENGAAKLSVLFFYLRIDRLRIGCPPWFRSASIATMILVLSITISSFMVVFLQCIPFSYQWKGAEAALAAARNITGDSTGFEPKGKCINIIPLYYVNAAVNFLTDFIIYLLPIRFAAGLDIPNKQKIGLVGILGIGAFICIVSIFRIASLSSLINSKDVTYDTANPMLWYYVEVNLIVIAASIPSLKAFFRRYYPRILGTSRSPGEDDHLYEDNTPEIRTKAPVALGEEGRIGETSEGYELEHSGIPDRKQRKIEGTKPIEKAWRDFSPLERWKVRARGQVLEDGA